MQRSYGSHRWRAFWFWAMGVAISGVAHADTLLDQANIVGVPSVAAPSQFAFTASTAEALTVVLTDFKEPAAFGSLQIAVTLNDTLVGSASVDATATATIAVPAAAGNYMLYVIGAPNATAGFGSFGVCVSATSDATHACISSYSYSGNITNPSTPSATGASTLDTNFTSTVAGTYTITLSDASFPAALSSLSAIITQGSTQVGGIVPAGVPTQVTLAAGTEYTLLAAAQANASVPAGLYGITIKDPSGAAIFDRSIPVGTLGSATVVSNPATQALSLTLTDYAYPSPLASVGVAVTYGGTTLGSLTAAGSASIAMAPAGSLDVWTYTVAGGQPGVYSVELSNDATSPVTVYATTQVVNPTGTSANSFAFIAQLAKAGTYQLEVSDFAFPLPLQSVSATVAQDGAVLAQTSGGNFTAQAGVAVIVVDATPPQSGEGIFAVTVESTGTSPEILLDQTQAVGGEFVQQPINVGTSGGYEVSLTDLAFPAAFPYQQLAVIVSRGSQVLGKVYSNGSFPMTVTPGQYVVTLLATPGTENYGLYGISIASAAPTLTFTAAASSVTVGTPLQLTWSSQNATACTASGPSGWTGPQQVTGSTSVVIQASVTLTLSCTGPGGSVTKSLQVTATTKPSTGGGGGRIDPVLLFALATMFGARSWQIFRRIRQRAGDVVTHMRPW